MAEHSNSTVAGGVAESPVSLPTSVEEARVLAKQRFKERLTNGEKVGDCACHDDERAADSPGGGAKRRVVGARFIDSGQVYFFDPVNFELSNGDWIVVSTSRGLEAARVVIAPHQTVSAQLKGELKPVERRMSEVDIERMESLRKNSASALRTFGAEVRARRLPMKPISAEYNLDGSALTLSFSAADRVDFRDLARDLNQKLRCRIELRQVSAREEAKLLGGLGRCGRTLCCSTWLPMFPDITMGMAKTQDLSLNPSKVSGVCGRLLCCLSYENEQYRQMKAVMPKLGQRTETPLGAGTVVSLQLLKGLVTVLLETENQEHTFPARELGFGEAPVAPIRVEKRPKQEMSETVEVEVEVAAAEALAAPAEDRSEDSASEKRSESRNGKRRRRRRNRGNQSQPSTSGASVGDAGE